MAASTSGAQEVCNATDDPLVGDETLTLEEIGLRTGEIDHQAPGAFQQPTNGSRICNEKRLAETLNV